MSYLLKIFTSVFVLCSLQTFAATYVPETAKVCRVEIKKAYPEVFCDGNKVKVLLVNEDPITATINDLLRKGFKVLGCNEPVEGQNYTCLFIRE